MFARSNIIAFQIGGLTNFAHKLVARNHHKQRGRCSLGVCSQTIPAHAGIVIL